MRAICLPLLLFFVACRCPKPATPRGNPMEDPAFVEKMTHFATPGTAHQELARGAGSWSVDCRIFSGPGAEPVPMVATAKAEMILGGRYLQEFFEGEVMGRPFGGMMVLGHNNLDAEYFSIWLDNWGTGYSVSSGARDGQGRINLKGSMRDALTPEGRAFRHVSRFQSEDEHLVELYDTLPDGTEWMVMEMAYRRL